MKNNIVAVVVTYNRKQLVGECINAILAQQRASCDVIVLDNGSTDGTAELFENEFNRPCIDYTNNGRNLGCAESTARGIKKAIEKGYEYIWIMDDDVIPEPDALYCFMKMDKRLGGDWGMFSGAAYWTDGSISEANRQKKTLFTFMKDSDYGRELVRIRMASLASMFIKAEVVKEVGLLKGEYFIYSEDYDFCGRVGRRYPIYAVPASRVMHKMKVNGKADFVRESPDRLYRYKYLYRNDVDCYRQFGIAGWVYLVSKFLYTLGRLLIFEKENRRGKIAVLVKGYKEGFRFRPMINHVA